jgi:hypothetical protein
MAEGQKPDLRTAIGQDVRNPRRAYDRAGREIEPMTLGNMRQHGVRSVDATCEACGHEAVINVDALADEMYVPDVALKLRCSACDSKKIAVRPDWSWRDHFGLWSRPST